MMLFTHQQLEQLAKWQPIGEGIARFDASGIPTRIKPGIDALVAAKKWHVRVEHDGGMENFYAISIRPANDPRATIHNPFPRVPGLLAYFSLLCPVAAVSRTSVLAGDDLRDWQEMSLEQVIKLAHGMDEMIDDFLDAFECSGYAWASREELSQPLPETMQFEGFCYGPEPWGDRVFHLLFQGTD